MKRIVLFGNSGSGKSTLAKELCESFDLAHLDLDTIAWQATSPPERKALQESKCDIDAFISSHNGWVIEGCYADLLELALPQSSEIIFLNLPLDTCVANARNRPWEPHKYTSKQAQDENLEMLIAWISNYAEREDVFSQSSHMELFTKYSGEKTMYRSNQRS